MREAKERVKALSQESNTSRWRFIKLKISQVKCQRRMAKSHKKWKAKPPSHEVKGRRRRTSGLCMIHQVCPRHNTFM